MDPVRYYLGLMKLLGKTAVDQENCCLAFADAVSHYSMLGLSVAP